MKRMGKGKIVGAWVAVVAVAALTLVAAAGQVSAKPPKDIRYFYGQLEGRSSGDLRMQVNDRTGRVRDIVFEGRSTCLYDGEKVEPFFGNRVITGFARPNLAPDGSFHNGAVLDTSIGDLALTTRRRVVGTVGVREATVTVRIRFETVLEPDSQKVVTCDTGHVVSEMNRVSPKLYEAIRSTSNLQRGAGVASAVKLKGAALVKPEGKPAYLRFRTEPMDARLGDRVFAYPKGEELDATQKAPRFWVLEGKSQRTRDYLHTLSWNVAQGRAVVVEAAFENGQGGTPLPIERFEIDRFTRPAG